LRKIIDRLDPPTNTGAGTPAYPHISPDNRLQQLVEQARNSQFQLSHTEYGFVMGLIVRAAPANVLVFGLGRDSELWLYLNRNGRTVFLENNAEWFHPVSGAECYLVNYPGLTLPESVQPGDWDIVFVDGPAGWRPEHPGRRESIRAAASLVKRPGGIVCLHDYDRAAEQQFCRESFGEPTYIFDRMAVVVIT
jgi:glucuronoxylan 4-O-methyltransferase